MHCEQAFSIRSNECVSGLDDRDRDPVNRISQREMRRRESEGDLDRREGRACDRGRGKEMR